MKEPNLLPVVSALIVVNATGFLLRYFDIDTYIILIGFRFHLAAVVSLLFILRSRYHTLIKESFLKPDYKKIIPYLNWIFLPLGILLAFLYLTKNIELGDPEYFYEFGLSSIIDYPIYLIWNAPQFFMVFLFLVIFTEGVKYRLVTILFLTFLLFVFEFIPIGKEGINYFNVVSLIILSSIVTIVINYFRNIYLFSFFIFSILWLNLLTFGSSSKEMVNLLFAAQYHKWEGFFELNKEYTDYLPVACHTLTLVFVLITASLRKK